MSADDPPEEPTGDDPLLSVRGLEKYYDDGGGLFDTLLRRDSTPVKAVDGVSFDIQEGETLGLVGESGCGKSTTGETMLRLREPTGGTVAYRGDDVTEMAGEDLTAFRRAANIVFQDPYSSLDPRMTAGQSIREPLAVHDVGTTAERKERAADLMERVGLSAEQIDRYPHEFSGGQRQRIGIARALALEPEFVVLDEPVSALDVSVQAQVLNLLDDLQSEFDLTYLFIAHDLSVVRHISDRVAVMYLGEIVEVGPTARIFEDPRHPYTEALLESVPRADVTEQGRDVDLLPGDVPSPRNPPSGCRFRTRCPAVIPPEDLAIDQGTFRDVMFLRDRLERGDLSAEDVDAVDDWRSVFDGDPAALSATGRDAMTDAFAALVEDRTADAVDRLAETFESVCETESPALGDGAHVAACHLTGD